MKKGYIFTVVSATIIVCLLSACSNSTNGIVNDNNNSMTNSTITQNSSVASEKSKNAILGDFETVDINNNPFDQSVFTKSKLTMVNIWATFCGPCINEMPDLAELNKQYDNEKFQIVGIPVDIVDQNGNISNSGMDTAKEIIDKTGADYVHLMPSTSLIKAKLNKVSSVPETIFIDENGYQVGKSYIGSRSKVEWQKIIDELLEQ